jgi:hypothetical protein
VTAFKISGLVLTELDALNWMLLNLFSTYLPLTSRTTLYISILLKRTAVTALAINHAPESLSALCASA